MQGVVEIKAGQDGEHKGLQESDDDLKPGQDDDEGQRKDAEQPQGDDKTGEHLEQRMPGQHVGEQPHA